ncbi:hypothetical protein GCM10027612_65450 [Microbispora bryophytorum subsp. camponoti]
MEIPLLHVRRQRLLTARRRLHRRGDLELDDRQPQSRRIGGLLQADGQMAGVQADAEVHGVGAAEQRHRLRGGLHDAARLGLEADPDRLAGALRQGSQAPGEHGQVGVDGRGLGRRPAGAPGEGKRRDRALGHVVGQQRGEDLGQVEGVGEPFRFRPVGPVDPQFHDLVVEAAVREAVEGDDLEPLLVQPGAQPGELGGVVAQRPGGAARQPQPEPEPPGAAQRADAGGDPGELLVDSREVLGGVHVGAVRQMDDGPGGMKQAHGQRVPRRIVLPS